MIQIELRPEIEARLATEAQARGVEVRTYIESLIEQAISAKTGADHHLPTGEEMHVFFQTMAADSDKIPQLAG